MTQPRNLDDLFPLTPMQHLMLLHALTAEHQGALRNQVCYEIRGPLRTELFRQARQIATVSNEFMLLYLEAALVYWVVCLVLSSGQSVLEKRLDHHVAH